MTPRVRLQVEALETRTLLTAGYLDPPFNNGGLLEARFTGADASSASRVAVQADGKIVVAGNAATASPPPTLIISNRPALARFNPDGSFDATFGQGGQELVGAVDDSIGDLVLQGDGKLVVAGRFGGKLAVRRFNPDGSPDATFTDPGLESGGTFLELQDLAVQ